MEKPISFYYNNSNNLTLKEIKDFIKKIIDIEIKRLNIETPIEILFLYKSNLDYVGALVPNYLESSNNRFVFPLKTNKYTLEINQKDLEYFYEISKDKKNNVGDILIPQTLNFLSMVVSLCSHEVRHAYQSEQIKNNKLDEIETILWLKQLIVRNFFEDIYDLNYDNYFTEQDSNAYQHQLSFEMLDKYSMLSNINLEKYKKYLKDKQIVPCIDKKIDVLYKEIDNKKVKRVATAYVIELFNKIVKQLPKEYISNSLLKYEYNNDGTKKTYIELMKEKEYYKQNGQNYDELYDFIINCDYNLQVQKYSLKLQEIQNSSINGSEKELSREDCIRKLKRAYAIQEFNYKDMHVLIQKRINSITKELRDLSIKNVQKQISDLDMINKKRNLLTELSNYRNLEIQIMINIKDYRLQKEEFLEQEKIYNSKKKLIEDYKNKKGILDVIENGFVNDITNYNKLIALVIKELNNTNIDDCYKEYLLSVKEAIQTIHLSPSKKNNKVK